MTTLTPTAPASIVTAAHQAQYAQKGFFVLERVIPPAHLAIAPHRVRQAHGGDGRENGGRRNRPSGPQFPPEPLLPFGLASERAIKTFVFSDLMADICRSLLGPDAYLSFEQFVVKFPEKGM